MTTFILDTSGCVLIMRATDTHPHPTDYPNGLSWGDLTPFAQGYIEALLTDFASRFALMPPTGPAREVAFSDLAPETLARIIADCAAACLHPMPFCATYSAEGGSFWSERQDGVYVAFPPLTVWLGDDGKVRFA